MLNVAMVATFCVLNVATVATFCVLNVATVTSTRHVQKTPFVINLLGLLTFICILVPRTIFDLKLLIKISFQGCPKPFHYTKENAKNTKENELFSFFNF